MKISFHSKDVLRWLGPSPTHGTSGVGPSCKKVPFWAFGIGPSAENVGKSQEKLTISCQKKRSPCFDKFPNDSDHVCIFLHYFQHVFSLLCYTMFVPFSGVVPQIQHNTTQHNNTQTPHHTTPHTQHTHNATLCENSRSDVERLLGKSSLDLSPVERPSGHSAPGTHRGKERFPSMTPSAVSLWIPGAEQLY